MVHRESLGALGTNKTVSTVGHVWPELFRGDPMGSLWGPGAPPGLPGAPNCSKAWNFSPHTASRLAERGLLTAPGRDP